MRPFHDESRPSLRSRAVPGGRFGRGAAAAAILSLALLIGAARASNAYRDGPPAAHTGGFGEPTCHTCHSSYDLDAGPDTGARALELRGVSASYVPGRRHVLTVVLRDPEMRVAGFQLAARFADGSQAGTLEGVDARVATQTGTGGVRYAQHSRAGTSLTGEATIEWRVVWQAPAEARPVTFHLAANAGNDDASEFGDVVLVRELRTRPAEK